MTTQWHQEGAFQTLSVRECPQFFEEFAENWEQKCMWSLIKPIRIWRSLIKEQRRKHKCTPKNVAASHPNGAEAAPSQTTRKMPTTLPHWGKSQHICKICKKSRDRSNQIWHQFIEEMLKHFSGYFKHFSQLVALKENSGCDHQKCDPSSRSELHLRKL